MSPSAPLALRPLVLVLLAASSVPAPARSSDLVGDARRAIILSIDGLLPPVDLPNYADLTSFRRLEDEGACTSNARIDPGISQTLPMHVSMLTGRFVEDHAWRDDYDWKPGGPLLPADLDGNNAFDLASGEGGRTCMFVGKSKLELFDYSWDGVDYYFFHKRGEVTTDMWLRERDACTFTFLHWKEPDKFGHRHGGHGRPGYLQGVREADVLLGRVLDNVDNETALIVTTDHGFERYGNHNDENDVHVFKVPFCVRGPGVGPGTDLYDLNRGVRADPYGSKTGRATYPQPIRPHDAARLALDFLGADAAEGSPSLINDMYVGSDRGGGGGGPPSSPTITVSWSSTGGN